MTNLSGLTEKNTLRLGIWTAAWVGTMAIATFGPTYLWDHQSLTITAVIINLVIGLGLILANIRHLRSLDEMMQRIQLEAMGLALGVAVIAGLSYSLLDTTNIIAADAQISYLVILISIVYLGSVVINMRRYK